jgi:uncharacterized protein (DUF4415 family)
MTTAEELKRANAQQAVSRAIRNGLLPHPNKAPCTDCGRKWTPDGPRHEYDHIATYEKADRLKVEVVCRPCHVRRTASRVIPRPHKVKERLPRELSGRPRHGKEKKRRVNLMLDQATYDHLKNVGDGNASAGLAMIVLLHVASELESAVKKLPKRRAGK